MPEGTPCKDNLTACLKNTNPTDDPDRLILRIITEAKQPVPTPFLLALTGLERHVLKHRLQILQKYQEIEPACEARVVYWRIKKREARDGHQK